MALQEKSCASLADDVIEIILAFLSITDIPSASLVCKQWRSFITSSPLLRSLSNSIHKPKPWLFLLEPNTTTGLGFDPVARKWIRLPPFNFYSSAEDVIMEGNGFLFSVAGGRLRFTHSFLNPCNWQETAASMRVWRQHPVVSYDCHGDKIFVIGGAFEFEEDPLCVEMFDVKSGAWEMCDPLPEHFKQSASSTWLSSAVWNGKVYVMEKYRGECCCYELQSKRWGRVVKVRPPSLSLHCECLKYMCLACSSGLGVAVLMREEGKMSLSIWRLEEETMECKVDTEIRMPSEMVSLIRGEEEEDSSSCGETIDCRGAGDLVYVFSNSMHDSKRRVCLCDLSRGVWEILADDKPGFPVNCRNRALFVCSPVTIDQTSVDFQRVRSPI